MPEKFCLKPLNKENFLSFYLPANGLVSYAALSINIMNPTLKTRLLESADLTNFLLWNTVVGAGAYIYSRKHLQKLPINSRIIYGGCGGILFSFGSVLMWAFLKNVLPKNNSLATFVGLASGLLIVRVSTDYMTEVDKAREVD